MFRPVIAPLRALSLLILSGAVAVSACGGRSGDVSAATDQVTISLVGTSDLHGNMLERSGRGGLSLFAGYLANLRAARAADGGGVLLVDAGDMFQGTLESNLNEGAAVVSAFNELGYNAAAVGNHEFDFGPVGPQATPHSESDDPRGALKARAAEARFPFLAANVIDDATGVPVAWPNVKPSLVIEVAGVKIGVLGVTTASTPVTTIAANLRGLTIAPLAPAIEREASALRKQGASVVVVAAHAGGRCTRVDSPTDLSSCRMDEEIFRVVQALPRGLVDVVVAGHTHNFIANEVNGVAVLESGAGGLAFSRTDLVVSRSTGKLAERRILPPHDICSREEPSSHRCDPAAVGSATLVASTYEGKPVAANETVARLLVPAAQEAAAQKGRSLGVVLEETFPRPRLVESAFGNLFADAILDLNPSADISITNGGAIRTELGAGELTYGQLYAAYPFDNRLVMLRLRGDQLRKIFAQNLESLDPAREIILTSGIQVVTACKSGALDVRLLRPSGTPIRDDERLRVVTNDFVATGGDGILTPAGPLGDAAMADVDEPLIRDIVANWLERRGGRIRPEQFLSANQRRFVYPGERPVRCES